MTDKYASYENRDGNAHMAYFADGISFVWGGGPNIQVCPNGYGEPATDLIPVMGISPLTLESFKEACEMYLGRIPNIVSV